MNEPVTQIVIVNFKTWRETLACLESVLLLKGVNFGVTIVEMCNIDHSRFHLKNWIENHQQIDTDFIEIEKNLGFAGANNAALRKLEKDKTHDFVWLLNNDTMVDKAALDELVTAWQQLENSGRKPAFIGSKIIDSADRVTIQSVGGRVKPWLGTTNLTGIGKNIKKFPSKGIIPTDYVMGASMFFHRSLLQEISLMDTSYFLYFEDVDWCYRAAAKGYRNYTCLSSQIFHKQGATTGNKYNRTVSDTVTLKYLHTSYLRFFSKHYPLFVPVALLMLIKQMAGRFARKHFKEAKAIAGVLFDYPKNLFVGHLPAGLYGHSKTLN